MPSPNEEESPGITRRDTIIIAMLVNMAILFILFATAQKPKARVPAPPSPSQMKKTPELSIAAPKKQMTSTLPVDEIDQILQQYVPAKEVEKKELPAIEKPAPEKPAKKAQEKVQEPQYYIVKEGDNPWKIAKKFNIKFEELLERNNLDEEKARNLKVGQKLRIK
jgi:LysM repeat protein